MINPSDRILITGGQGFLGKFVEKALRAKDYKNVFTANKIFKYTSGWLKVVTVFFL